MLVERENELKTLFEMQAATNAGRGQIALVSGEAGIGKSALLAAFRDAVSARSPKTNWYAGGCEALFTPRTLGPIHDMAPELGQEVEAALDAETGQSALYTAILSALDADEPSVMVCEDLHWADYATLDLIKYVARRISLLPVMLIITFRDDELSLSNPLTQLLGDLPGGRTKRLSLNPLSEEAVSRLSAEKGYDPRHLFEITNGNPFYLTELLAAQSDGEFVPASVKDAVALRLSQLEPAERELLERISVLPTAPKYSFLEELLGQDALEQIAVCVAKGLLVEDGVSVRFRHELARLATFDRITPARRRNYHSECLKILTEAARRSPLDQIVHHASGAYDSQKVLSYAPQAAKAAAQVALTARPQRITGQPFASLMMQSRNLPRNFMKAGRMNRRSPTGSMKMSSKPVVTHSPCGERLAVRNGLVRISGIYHACTGIAEKVLRLPVLQIRQFWCLRRCPFHRSAPWLTPCARNITC